MQTAKIKVGERYYIDSKSLSYPYGVFRNGEGGMSGCLNCGSTNAVTACQQDGQRRLWCCLCGYWADRKKPAL